MVTLPVHQGISQNPSPSPEEYRTEEFYAIDMKVKVNENEEPTNSANEDDELLIPRPNQLSVVASESRVNSVTERPSSVHSALFTTGDFQKVLPWSCFSSRGIYIASP